MTSTQTQDLTASTSTTSPQEERPDAAAQWAATIEALETYKRECEAQDRADEEDSRRRRAAEVERGLDDLARECRRLDREAAAKPTKKR